MEDAQAFLDRMVRERGYVLDFHKTLAAEDFEFLRTYNALIEAAYLNNPVLDDKTKELLYTAVLTAIGPDTSRRDLTRRIRSSGESSRHSKPLVSSASLLATQLRHQLLDRRSQWPKA